MLNDLTCRKAKPIDKPFKLADSGGLHLYVTPAGGKLWRFRYEFGGKEKTLSLGPYPAVTLADARTARDDAKATLRAGRDPNVAKRLVKAAVAKSDSNTFEKIAFEWHKQNESRWTRIHALDVINSLRSDIFPTLGPLPITEITAPMVLAELRKIEERGAIETAHRIRQRMSAVFVFAVATGRAESDPAGVVKGALSPVVKGRQPAIVSLAEAREMLAKAESEPAHVVTKLALRFLALTAVRPGTLTATPWVELLNIPANVWTIPAARMKLNLKEKSNDNRDHLVPLSTQALDVIEVLKKITGGGPLVFPNTRQAYRPMSENAMGYLLNRAGYHHKHVPHGWRATFSTVMNDAYPADRAVIDLMLAHIPGNKVESAYNRAAHLSRRTEISQLWADLILKDFAPAIALVGLPSR